MVQVISDANHVLILSFAKMNIFSDVLDGKRLPLPNQTTFKILVEGILKTIVVYAILLIIVHMDR